MATAIRFLERITGGGRIADTTTGQGQSATYGQGVLPSRTFRLDYGTASGQVSKWYLAQRTLAATTYDLLDLAGGLTDYKGAALTFTKVKRVLLQLTDPNGTRKLYLGPQNQSAAAQLWFGGTGATVYEEVFYYTDRVHPYAGWTVTATSADILPVYNPGATSVTYAIWILGI